MTNDGENVDGPRRRGIQSVEIGLSILHALGKLGRASTLGTVAQACGMASPQVHRYLQSLIVSGMARQDPTSGHYDLGPAAIQLGLSALARTDAYKLVDVAISEFVFRTDCTVQVAAFGPLGPTIVRWYAGRPGVVTSLGVGSVLPVLTSATGQIFLAFDRRLEISDLTMRELRRSELTKVGLANRIDEVRRAGRASVTGTLIPGLNATAFPIFDLQGRPVLTATLLEVDKAGGIASSELTEELCNACAAISRDLGWPGKIEV